MTNITIQYKPPKLTISHYRTATVGFKESPSIFGNSAPAPATTSLFGTAAPKPAFGFGAAAATTTSATSLFGTATPTKVCLLLRLPY